MSFETIVRRTLVGLAAAILPLAAPGAASAHCDTLDGPVVLEARTALETGDLDPVLKWVKPEHEAEIREVFTQSRKVRGEGPEARDLADRYFLETLVRVHRAGEGAPYTGLKPAGEVDPAVVLADEALESGSADKLVATLTGAVEDGIRERFAAASGSREHASDGVGEGREFVAAYVEYVHFVEKLHLLLKGAAHDHGASEAH